MCKNVAYFVVQNAAKISCDSDDRSDSRLMRNDSLLMISMILIAAQLTAPISLGMAIETIE